MTPGSRGLFSGRDGGRVGRGGGFGRAAGVALASADGQAVCHAQRQVCSVVNYRAERHLSTKQEHRAERAYPLQTAHFHIIS